LPQARGWHRLRILITNNTLGQRGGTELYVRDLAMGLLERGHEPIAYSSQLGDVARDIEAAGVKVVADLGTIPNPPDIIHGQHHLETMIALLRLPATPAIYFCHGSTPWEEAAPRFPRILQYVAVDEACRDRLTLEDAIPAEQIRVLLNFVDLKRFQARSPLPSCPKRALIFSNQANENNYVREVRVACNRAGMEMDVVGWSAGNVCAEPELVLGNYDIVFAKGRAALEALAVGASVVVCDEAGAGPMVTSENVARLRPLNFGIRVLRERVTADIISAEIDRYDPSDAARVSSLIRATAGRDAVIDQLLSIYQDVIDEHSRIHSQDVVAEQNAVAAYLDELKPRLQAVEMLEAKETELKMIKSSRSWIIVTRYASMKRKVQSSVANGLARLTRKPEKQGPTT
jgi:hypothetical protein